MKAVVYTAYGPPDVLQLKEVEKPTPADNEILAKVRAAAVTSGDVRIRGMNVSGLFWLPARLMFGIIKPKRTIPGSYFAGEVEAVGEGVKQFKPGDPVFGTTGMAAGAHAEYLSLPEEKAVTQKPTNVNFEEAAAIPFGALAALYFLKDKGKVRVGQRVLINGSGAVGLQAVQIAKNYGAHVTGVGSTAQLETIQSLGADEAIDYTKQDFTTNGKTYHIIFDTVGKTSYARCKNSLTPSGRYLLTVFNFRQLLEMLWTSVVGNKKVICAVAGDNKEDLNFIKELIEQGDVRAVIDRQYSMDQIAEAHRYIETGQKAGSVVLRVDHTTEQK